MPNEPQFLYLITTGRRTGLPRRIEIWFTQLEDRFYIIAEHGYRAQWVQNVQANARVVWKVGEKDFQGQARVLDSTADASLIHAVQDLSRQKYGWGDGLVVELTSGTS